MKQFIDIEATSEQDAMKTDQLQELARQGKVFICYGPVPKEKLRELELEKLKRWNAAAVR